VWVRFTDLPAGILARTTSVALAAVASVAVCLLAPRLANAQGKDLEGVVNLNTAGADLLQLLPGVGPAKVRSIYLYRQKRPFRTVDELVRIKGIGRKMVRQLRGHLAVSGPSTAHAVHRPRDAELPPIPLSPPPAAARKPIAITAAAKPLSPWNGHDNKPRPSPGGEGAGLSRANHCLRRQ
jgi:competence protein ComEA